MVVQQSKAPMETDYQITELRTKYKKANKVLTYSYLEYYINFRIPKKLAT